MINKATKNKVIIWGSNGCGPCPKLSKCVNNGIFEYEWNNIDDPEVKEKFMQKYPAIRQFLSLNGISKLFKDMKNLQKKSKTQLITMEIIYE